MVSWHDNPEDEPLYTASEYLSVERRLAELQEAVMKLKRYAKHTQDCVESGSPFCQCGLDAVRSAVDALIGGS